METYDEISVDFIPAHATAFLLPMNKGRNFSFKSYYLKNVFHGATGAIDSSYIWKHSGKDSLHICHYENL